MTTHYLITNGELKTLSSAEYDASKLLAIQKKALYIISNFDIHRDYKLYYGDNIFEINSNNRDIYKFLRETAHIHKATLIYGHAIAPDEWMMIGNIQFYYIRDKKQKDYKVIPL